MGHRAGFLLIVAAFAALVVAGAAPAQEAGGTLRLGEPHGLDSVDPAVAWRTDSWMLEYATCAKLYNYPDKPDGTALIPEVAADFPRLSNGGKTQTIELKKTYRFHTGAPITAANYVAAFNRDANPSLQSGAAGGGYLNEIVGAQQVIEGKAAAISGVKALGPYELQIRTTRPVQDLSERLTMPFFCPIAVGTPPQEIHDPLGSGPYYLASHVPNRGLTLERNRFYRGPRPHAVDRIVWSFTTAPEECRQALEADEVDWCAFIPPSAYPEIAAKYGINKPGGQFFFKPTLNMLWFVFNHDRPAFKGPGQIPLKQAINWAIDRPALARAAGYLSGKRTDQIMPTAMGGDVDNYPIGGVTERSLAHARALFAKATYKPDKLVLYTHTPGFVGVNAVWAQIFQFNLKRLGIDVEIKYFPGSISRLLPIIQKEGEPWDVTIMGWFPDYADGVAFFEPLLDGRNLGAPGDSNYANFDRPAYNRKIDQISRLTGDARRKAWADLDREMMRDDPPFAPFMAGVERDFVSRSYGCYVFQPAFGFPDLAAACKR